MTKPPFGRICLSFSKHLKPIRVKYPPAKPTWNRNVEVDCSDGFSFFMFRFKGVRFSGLYLVEIQNTLIKGSLVAAPFQLLLDFFQIFCCSLLLTTIHQHVGNMLATLPNFPTCKKYLGLGIPLVGRPALFLLKLPPPIANSRKRRGKKGSTKLSCTTLLWGI